MVSSASSKRSRETTNSKHQIPNERQCSKFQCDKRKSFEFGYSNLGITLALCKILHKIPPHIPLQKGGEILPPLKKGD